jgi:predicted RNA-binding Zn ribbon-like protein
VADSRQSAAPGQLGLVQSFLNSLDRESGRDELVDTAHMEGWLAARRLISPGTEFDDTDRRRLVDVRNALYSLVASNGGQGVHRRAVTTLNEAARRIRLGVRLHPEDGYRLMAEGVGIDRPIGELLIGVTASMASGSWNRLKVCANGECQLAFYDASRNRSGRWCSMATCGNRNKGRAYRRRQTGKPGMSEAPKETPSTQAAAS